MIEPLRRVRMKEDIKRMIQGGRPEGWILAAGRRFDLDRTTWVCERDRSWGIRVAGADFIETGVQPPEIYPGQLFNFVYMQYADWGASFHLREIWDDALGLARRWHFSGGIFYPLGSDRPPMELREVEHFYEFDDRRPEQRRRLAGGRVVLTAIDGTRKEVTAWTIGRLVVTGNATLYQQLTDAMARAWHATDIPREEQS